MQNEDMQQEAIEVGALLHGEAYDINGHLPEQ
jgi:hypothetical protein